MLMDVHALCLALNETPLLKGVDLSLKSGSILGLVGASGSGKSLTALSLLVLPPLGSKLSGTIQLNGRSLLTLGDAELCGIRGSAIGMVFQESASSFDPLRTVGDHVTESIRWHLGLGREAARIKARQALKRAEFPADIDAFKRYPHEVSGGQRQRAMIAAALVLSPQLLLADEPTTALDVTTQASILTLFRRLANEDKMAILIVSHDLPAIATIADEVALMEKGTIVERSATSQMSAERTPKLAALFASARPRGSSAQFSGGDAVLRVSGICHAYSSKPSLNDVSFTLRKGECLGVVGQSGSGKSTLARIVAGLSKSSTGNIEGPKGTGRVQMVFQDPLGSFNPRWTLGQSIAEPLRTSRRDEVENALRDVGLDPSFAHQYPHEVSGGQAQRAAIARALIAKPDLLVLDEAVSALDVAVRGQVLDLLDSLRVRYGLAMLFITHDLGVARSVANRLLVLHEGSVVEEGVASEVLSNPRNPHTQALVAASPSLNDKFFAPERSAD